MPRRAPPARGRGAGGLPAVLVGGGARLDDGLLRAGLADGVVWFRNSRVIGGDGLPAAAGLGIDKLADAPAFRRMSAEELGDDTMETYERIT